MSGPCTRRRFLHACLVGSAVSMAGCSQADGTDLIVRNRDDESHSVTVTLDRGSSYDRRNESVSVEPGGETRLSGFIGSSDWPYPFELSVVVDGTRTNTTTHRWGPDPIAVTVHGDRRVTANDTAPTATVD